MKTSARRIIPSALVLAAATVVTPAGGAWTDEPARVLDVSTIAMEFPAQAGSMERPMVEFNHAAHARALEQDGCRACHTVGDQGFNPRLAAIGDGGGRDRLIDAYHDTCIGCHEERRDAGMTGGPITCGECHVRRSPACTSRSEVRFDGSLHGRHALAYPDTCDPCHHVYDEGEGKLRYEKGAEEACGACHGKHDEDRRLSLRNATHVDCVGCHLQRVEQRLEAGPVQCVGCHDGEHLQAIKKLEAPPRLVRGQPDAAWLRTPGIQSKPVPFPHLGHEKTTDVCSDCHHSKLKPCRECHGLVVADDGGGVVLERAHHMPGSPHSCIGCHSAYASSGECAGCHIQLRPGVSERSCATCHSGPEGDPVLTELAAPVFEPVKLAALPAVSDLFPETIEIGWLADRYEASRLPHAKIVTRLDTIARASRLASRFHGGVDPLCAGCHHNSPIGSRPPPCRSCHGADHDGLIDRPDLKTAYHRQCLGCHIAMAIEQQSCTACHASRESAS